jgi:hypothetical protein
MNNKPKKMQKAIKTTLDEIIMVVLQHIKTVYLSLPNS